MTHRKENLDLDVTCVGKSRYKVEIHASRGGDAEHCFTLPFTRAQWEAWKTASGLQEIANRQAGDPGPLTGLSKAAVGRMLYDSLLGGDVGVQLERLRALSRERDRGIRLRLRLNHQNPSLQPFAALPWETMYEERGIPAYQSGLTIVRQSQHRDPPKPLALPTPLDVLVVAAEPKGLPTFNREQFTERLTQSFQDDNLRLSVMEGPVTLDRLREVLHRQPCHILIFVGHGGKVPGHAGPGPAWSLAFEDENGGAHPVDAVSLHAALSAFRELSMVCLFSCDGAVWSGSSDQPAFEGTAASLTALNLPAVLAMQAPLLIEALPLLAQKFFKRLAMGMPVDAALDDARTSLFMERRTLCLSWGTPVLYLRAEDGKLFRDPPRIWLNSYETTAPDSEPAYTAADFADYFEDAGQGKKSRLPTHSGNWKRMVDNLARLERDVREQEVLFFGRACLSLYFASGRTFCQAAGYRLRMEQKNYRNGHMELWSSQAAPAGPAEASLSAVCRPTSRPEGADLAVILAVSRSQVIDGATAYIQEHVPSAGKILTLCPEHGPDRTAMHGNAEALQVVRAAVKHIETARQGGKVHLFLSCPSGLALFLGHELSSTGPIQCYEFTEARIAYTPSVLMGGMGLQDT